VYLLIFGLFVVLKFEKIALLMTSLIEPKNEVKNTSSSARLFSFVPFPHKRLPTGPDAGCQWKTMQPQASNDVIQNASANEGACYINVSTIERYGLHIHIFSQEQAIICLNQTAIIIAGDSYTKQLAIGLGDILLGRDSNHEIKSSKERSKVLDDTIHELRVRDSSSFGFPSITYACAEACYGQRLPFATECSKCLRPLYRKAQQLTSNKTALVAGVGVHMRHRIGPNESANQMKEFQNKLPSIMVSVPSYQVSKQPFEYAETTDENEQLYQQSLQLSPFLYIYNSMITT
jgi:hypothetical protein